MGVLLVYLNYILSCCVVAVMIVGFTLQYVLAFVRRNEKKKGELLARRTCVSLCRLIDSKSNLNYVVARI